MNAEDPPSPRDTGHVPTLADVARLAGVSTATVSRCLNSPDRVIDSTRDRVMAAVDSLGYAPNFSARALAARRTNTIGAVIPTMENAIFARGIQAFQEELGRHGITLLIASSSYQHALEAEQIRTLVARGADGLLLIGHDRGADIRKFIAQRAVPTLVAWSYDPKQALPSIGFDNQASMAELAQLVLRYGHQRVGVISAHTATNDRARDRVAGVRTAARAAGLSEEALHIVETDYGVATGGSALRQILTDAPDTTAVLCGNDVLAIGALRAAKEMGLRVPQDLSITGFDDIDLAMLAEPGLTTVHVPHREMGRRAADMLVQMVKDNVPPRSVALPTQIRLRDSLGPVSTAPSPAGSP